MTLDHRPIQLRNETAQPLVLGSLELPPSVLVTLWEPGSEVSQARIAAASSQLIGDLFAWLTQGFVTMLQGGAVVGLVDAFALGAELQTADPVAYYVARQSPVRFQQLTGLLRTDGVDQPWPTDGVLLAEAFTRVPAAVAGVSTIPAQELIEGVFSAPATATCDVEVAVVDDEGVVLLDMGVRATMRVTCGAGAINTTLNSGPYLELLELPPGRYRLRLVGRCDVVDAFSGWAQLVVQSYTLAFPGES